MSPDRAASPICANDNRARLPRAVRRRASAALEGLYAMIGGLRAALLIAGW